MSRTYRHPWYVRTVNAMWLRHRNGVPILRLSLDHGVPKRTIARAFQNLGLK